jgi:hypothetical protein
MLRTLLQAGGDDVVGTVFECSLGAVPARVVVLGQQVITATVGSSAGLDALVRTLLVEPQQVQQRPASPSLVSSLSALPTLGPLDHVLATVDAQLEQLRLEAVALGGLQGQLAVQLVLLGNHKATLPDDVQRLARLADGTRDVATLLVEAPLAPPLALRALLKLSELGIVARVDEGRSTSVVDRHWQRLSQLPTDANSTPTTSSSPPAPGPVTPLVSSLPTSSLGASSLPASVPHPRAQRSLADDDAFFAEHAPPSSLPMVLAVVAALIVIVVVGALLFR